MTETTFPHQYYNVVIVGCGQIVTHHVEALFGPPQPQQPSCHLLAVCDPSVERREIILQQVQQQQQQQQQVAAAAITTNTTNTTTLQFNTLDDLIEYSANNHNHHDQHHDSSNETATNPPLPLIHSIDLLLIAVPHDLHESTAIRALEATQSITTTTSSTPSSTTPDHHHHTLVVLEKPIAITLASCERLRLASIQYQHRLIIAEQSPYWPAVRAATALLRRQGKAEEEEEQVIGDRIIAVASYYYESMRDNITSGSVETTTGNLGWRGSLQRAGGGILIDGGLHWIRPIREICTAAAASASADHHHHPATEYRISKVMGVTCPVPSIQSALGMEGETLGHALLELTPDAAVWTNGPELDHDTSSTVPPPPTIVATYSACLLPSPAVMAHDACPYLRITGTTGELVIAGTGLQRHTPSAGGLTLYNPQYPQGREILHSRNETDNEESSRTDFFMAFTGLWEDIRRIHLERDEVAAHNSVLRAIDDVRTVLAIYASAQSRQWEST